MFGQIFQEQQISSTLSPLDMKVIRYGIQLQHWELLEIQLHQIQLIGPLILVNGNPLSEEIQLFGVLVLV